MKTKLLPFLLAVSVCLALFAGCQSSELHSYSEDAAASSSSPSSTDTTTAETDFTPAYESYDPDEVMLTVNGIDVTWGELFYWYAYDVSSLESYFGEITDWDAECGLDSSKTTREYVLSNALETVKNYCGVLSKAEELGVVLTDEDKADLQTTWESNVANYGNGDEDAFKEYLKTAYVSMTLYNRINEVTKLKENLLETMFGANGEKISETDVLEKGAELGYVRAKHILLSTVDDTGAALPDDQIAAKKATADALLAELKGITDKTALEARFDELIAANSEDPGMAYYTDGYTFVSGGGSMDTTFDAAVSALKDYELSEVVQTDYGYHIILRLPLKADAAIEFTSETEATTLAYYVAQDMFTSESDSWAQESKVEYKDAYNKMDLSEVFAKAIRPAAAG